MTVDGERQLIDSFGNKTARQVAAELVAEGGMSAPLAQRVIDATDTILARGKREIEWLTAIPQLARSGLQVEPSGQLHQLTGSLDSWSQAALSRPGSSIALLGGGVFWGVVWDRR